MDYKFEEFTIKKLVELLDNDKIDLTPPYQRNFIWSPNDQKELIDTIIDKQPLPSIFLYEKQPNKFEMVDGQQRARTIYRFVKGYIKSSKKHNQQSFDFFNSKDILNYKLSVITITKIFEDENLNDFFVKINKKGKHLNNPELHNSEFSHTNFLRLANELLAYQNLINLDLFSEATSKRMNDRDFVQELIIYLKLGIRDKKLDFGKIFENDFDDNEYSELMNKFQLVIDIIEKFNKITSIKKTRYKQKNDFYTLFCFVDQNKTLKINTLIYQYEILVLLSGKTKEGFQYIRPSNEDCEALKEYALNCVSQSNSKKARESRLNFFSDILTCRDEMLNDQLIDVLTYLKEENSDKEVKVTKYDGFYFLDTTPFK